MDIKLIANKSAKLATVTHFPSEGKEAPAVALAAHAKHSSANLQTWLHCLGHLNLDGITHMVTKGMVIGMEITYGSTITTSCEPCIKGKQTCAEIHKLTEMHSNIVLGCIFSDVCGWMPTKSHDRYKYFITWMDNKLHKVFVVGMHEKSKVTHHLKAFISWAEVEVGQQARTLCSNGGGKYIAGEAQRYLEEKGIKHKITMPHTPQHNGVAKRMNRTLLNKVWAMLIDADLPQSYWYDALHYAAHIHNITLTQSLNNITLEEAWSRNNPDISNLRTFGVRAYVHIPKSHHDKLAAHSLTC